MPAEINISLFIKWLDWSGAIIVCGLLILAIYSFAKERQFKALLRVVPLILLAIIGFSVIILTPVSVHPIAVFGLVVIFIAGIIITFPVPAAKVTDIVGK